ncbi:MAG: hypothetical protein GX552_02675 [Chloroflexi bacterium]|nr:hypothetical protein [Chloroflexota bacterium]
MTARFRALAPGQVQLLPSLFQQRFELNRQYLMSLKSEALLQNFHLEARLRQVSFRVRLHGEPGCGDDWHWGWESPTCQVRGHFLGHWLSAAGRTYASTGDAAIKAKADAIIAELGRCQERNGGEWVGSIPESYLHWTAKGQPTWAPQYVLHKTLMGLYDMYAYAGNEQALDIMTKFARWFYRWTGQFTREQMDNLLDVETGGMLEAWANLYGVTGDPHHLELVRRYDRPRLFEPLLAGKDVLTNMHANTTIPEVQGAARAYEVTGEERCREIVEAYWRCAVTERGAFCTGGQTCGEIWTPPFTMAARLGDKNQEHCTVYNMMRLADYLLRWTGDPAYADYIERNLYNGVLAQQNPRTGMISYFLPLEPGAQKLWGSPTNDFWCCHGSLVQAHTLHNAYTYYAAEDGLAICQYVPSELTWEYEGTPITVRQTFDREAGGRWFCDGGAANRPLRWIIDISVQCAAPVECALKLRLPWWLAGKATIAVNGVEQPVEGTPGTFVALRRTWQQDTVRLELPMAVTTCPLPDAPDVMAFMEGPVVLAGLCDEERTLYTDADDPAALLVADNEREWGNWLRGYRVTGQERGLRFKPLYEIVDERYTVYFPIRRR